MNIFEKNRGVLRAAFATEAPGGVLVDPAEDYDVRVQQEAEAHQAQIDMEFPDDGTQQWYSQRDRSGRSQELLKQLQQQMQQQQM